MRKLYYLLLWLLLWLAGCQSDPARPQPADYLTAIPDPKTLGETYVSNPDSVLAPATVAALNQRLDSLDRSRRAHLDVVVVRSIGEEVPKTAAYQLFNKWKVGDAQLDNGLLLLLVLDQRRVEFETGRGLEGDLPDAICFRIQQRYMLVPARAGNYDQAVRQGVAALIRQLQPPGATPAAVPDSVRIRQMVDSVVSGAAVQQMLQPEEQVADPPVFSEVEALAGPPAPGPDPVGTLVVLGLLLVLYLVLGVRTAGGRGLLGALGLVGGLLLAAMGFNWPPTVGQLLGLGYGLAALYLVGYFAWLRRGEQPAATPAERQAEYQRREKAHAGLSWVAGLFPMPLAAYWWWHRRQLHQLRYPASQPCPTCGQSLHLLTGAGAAAHLSPGQQAEVKLESVAYDVWQCAQGHALVPAYPNADSPALNCPACHFRTLLPSHREEVLDATTQASGWGWDFARCQFCQHERKTKYTIPRREEYVASSSSSSGSSSSWGSSSSSSSSSGSTSSGGSSGGGGAGSSW